MSIFVPFQIMAHIFFFPLNHGQLALAYLILANGGMMDDDTSLAGIGLYQAILALLYCKQHKSPFIPVKV